MSDGETTVKEEGGKNSKNSKKIKKKKQGNKIKSKFKEKGSEKKSNVKVKLEKVKTEQKEKEKNKGKEKENDKKKEKEKENDKKKEKEKKDLPKEGTGSLLDLLELEMRARAIRALIRKEEDSSAANAKTKADSDLPNNSAGAGTSNDDGSKARQASLKEQLEKIDVLMKHGEEDDIYVVINPAPTIDLLSSDSENENNPERTNKKLVNERRSETEILLDKNVENNKAVETTKTTNLDDTISHKNASTDKEKENVEPKEKDEIESKKKEIEDNNKNLNLPMSAIEFEENEKSNDLENKNPPEELEDGEIIDDENEKENEKTEEVALPSTTQGNIKKIKKNPHLRLKKRTKESSDDEKPCQSKISEKETDSRKKEDDHKEPSLNEPIEIKDSPERRENNGKESNFKQSEFIKVSDTDMFDDEKSLDIEEIINLDDYPDEMDDIEKSEPSKVLPREKLVNSDNNLEKDTILSDKTHSVSETWASRYIQQDGVQNVIKESKIQSEIRKRLRERQRQNKLCSSPKIDDQELSQEPIVPKPSGSVEEYLALKGIVRDSSNESSELRKTDSPTENDVDVKKDELNYIVEQVPDVVDKPIVIVKKPQLTVKILSIEKIDPVNQILAVERVSKIVNTTETVFNINSCAEADKLEEQSVKNDLDNEPTSNIETKNDFENKSISNLETKSGFENKFISNVETKNEIENESKSITGTKSNLKNELISNTETVQSVTCNIEDNSFLNEQSVPVGSSSPKNKVAETLSNLNDSIQSTEEKNTSLSREDEFTSRSDSSDDNIIVKIDNVSSFCDHRIEK